MIYNSNKVTVITVVFNNVNCIEYAIKSVTSQKYDFIEYIIVDGKSTDGTLEIIKKYRDNIDMFLSEPDNGIYDALNKGISLATGNIIAILHSDDVFCDGYVISDMVQRIVETNAEFCFSDLVIVSSNSNSILRYYMASYFKPWMLRMGVMPPHPTCFIKKPLFDKIGGYSTKYVIAGDFDFMVRAFLANNIRWSYLDRVTVQMRSGGISNSTVKNKILSAVEIHTVLRSHGVFSMYILQIGKYLIRAIEFIIKPKKNCETTR